MAENSVFECCKTTNNKQPFQLWPSGDNNLYLIVFTLSDGVNLCIRQRLNTLSGRLVKDKTRQVGYEITFCRDPLCNFPVFSFEKNSQKTRLYKT